MSSGRRAEIILSFERLGRLCKLKESVKKGQAIVSTMLEDEGLFDDDRLNEAEEAERPIEGTATDVTGIIKKRQGKCLASGARVKPGILADGTAAKNSFENSITHHINLLRKEKFRNAFPLLTKLFKDLLPYLKTVLPNSYSATYRTLISMLVMALPEIKRLRG